MRVRDGLIIEQFWSQDVLIGLVGRVKDHFSNFVLLISKERTALRHAWIG